MMHFNKIKLFTFIIPLLLGLSAPAFADGGIATPTPKGGWNVGIDALYLRANADNLGYAIVKFSDNLSSSNFNDKNAVIDPTYEWGFRLQTGYWFPCSCYDINLAYTRLNTVDSDAVSLTIPDYLDHAEIIVPPASNGNVESGITFFMAESKAEFNLSAVDLDVGRYISSSHCGMRIFGGLRYTKINNDIYTNAQQPPNEDAITANQQFTSHFKGVGPRIGARGRYGQYCGWGLDGDVSVAALIGQIDGSFQGNSFNNLGLDDHYASSDTKNSIIPVLEAKLGIDYIYPLGNCKHNAVLAFEAGYQSASYFNAINNPCPEVGTGSSTFTISKMSETSTVTFGGPYLGIKYYA